MTKAGCHRSQGKGQRLLINMSDIAKIQEEVCKWFTGSMKIIGEANKRCSSGTGGSGLIRAG